MDDLDKALIVELSHDGRTSVPKLSEKLGVTTPTVRSRLNRLLEAGRIKIAALTDHSGIEGATVLEVAIGALAAQPGCASVIAGATSPEQVKANAAAADWIPSPAELAELDQLVPPPRAE